MQNQSYKRTIVYVDSFNFYYGSLNKSRCGLKWLNIEDWVRKLLPPDQHDIQKIKYFTARVSGRRDPTKPIRQDIYFRALRTLPKIEIIEGFFLFNKKKIFVTPDVDIYATTAEEKGTDVNMALHLLNDAHNHKFDIAVIVSNDSDLSEAVKIVTQELKLKVGIINPYEKFNQQLSRYATFKKKVREGQITSSQFPHSIKDSIGVIVKPQSW
jgi:uncharacterized LabA/DUF88 family protein